MRGFLVGGGLLWALALGGCDSVCGRLSAHAQACGAVESRYVDERDSACKVARRSFGQEPFDDYAACVSGSACDDLEAIDVCLEDHLGEAAVDPCPRFTAWAAACGLEPLGLDNDCSGVSDTVGAEGFETWVACVTADGCPIPGDDRYDRCQDILPPELTDLLGACQKIYEWTARCEGQSEGSLPVAVITVPECLAQAQPFTIESYVTYADCQSALACDDLVGRVSCVLDLNFTDRTEIDAQCQTLIAYTQQCNSPIGGGTMAACQQLFPRFSTESFQAFIDCVLSYSCGDPTAAAECPALLTVE